MSLLILTRVVISLSITMLICTNPFPMALIILLIALSTSIIYAILHSSWLALLLFLIYVGGILVIFSYFLAVAPNQQLPNKSIILIPLLSFITFIISFLILIDSWVNPIPVYINLTSILFTPYNLPILIILVVVLLFTIIVVIKACKLEKGPLRSFISLYV
jgi:NADH:ubiquinone oxidoreductase subunit 6 (subunit J)